MTGLLRKTETASFVAAARVLLNPSLTLAVTNHHHSLISRFSASAVAVMPGADPQVVEWPATKVRDTFFKFFEDKNHVNWKSSPVVPVNDPTLLFANAGIIKFCVSLFIYLLV